MRNIKTNLVFDIETDTGVYKDLIGENNEKKEEKIRELLDKYSLEEIVQHYGPETILKNIGKDKVKSYLRKKKIKKILKDNE